MTWPRRLVVLLAMAAIVAVLWSYLTRPNDHGATAGAAKPAS
jgi:hypothetical protein